MRAIYTLYDTDGARCMSQFDELAVTDDVVRVTGWANDLRSRGYTVVVDRTEIA